MKDLITPLISTALYIALLVAGFVYDVTGAQNFLVFYTWVGFILVALASLIVTIYPPAALAAYENVSKARLLRTGRVVRIVGVVALAWFGWYVTAIAGAASVLLTAYYCAMCEYANQVVHPSREAA